MASAGEADEGRLERLEGPQRGASGPSGEALVLALRVAALELFQRACDGGDAGGCGSLAWLHQYGLGVAQSDTEAARFYTKGCDGGDLPACSNLGSLHLDGRGGRESIARKAGR